MPVEGDTCPRCGLPQSTPEVTELRGIVSRIGQIQRDWNQLAEEWSRLIAERDASFVRVWPTTAPAATASPPAPPRPELELSTVRNLLLVVGAVLVGLAALIFTGYAWSRLGASGRATMLAGITIVSGVTAVGIRRRLPATSEALAALTIGLVLVDWLAAAVATGVSDDRLLVWWAVGTAVAACIGAAGVAPFRSARVAVPLLSVVSGVLFVVAATDAPWLIGCGFAAVALVAVAIAMILSDWTPAELAVPVLAVGAAIVNGAGIVIVLAESIADAAGGWQHAAALAAAAVVSGLPVIVRRQRLRPRVERACAFATTGLLVGAGISIFAGVTAATATVAAASLLVMAAVAVLTVLPLPEESRVGATTALVTGACSTALLTVNAVGESMLLPLRWFGHAWSVQADAVAIDHIPDATTFATALDWAGVIVMAATAGALLLSTARLGERQLLPARHRALVAVPMVATVAMVPLVAGWTIGVAVAVQVAVVCGAASAAVLVRTSWVRWQVPLLLAGGAVLVPASGWALAARSTTVIALAVLLAVGVVVTANAAPGAIRTTLAAFTAVAVVGESAAIAVWSSGMVETTSIVVMATSAVLLAIGGLVPSLHKMTIADVVQWAGAAGMGVAVLLVTPGTTTFAVNATVATASLALAALGRHRQLFEAAASVAALAATWAWLGASDVKTTEAYTIPAAVLALGAGVIALRRRTSTTSWVLAPGLLIGLAPTLSIVLAEGDAWRAAILAVAAFSVLVWGAKSRLQAPITIAAITLVWLGLDAIWPTVAAAPRWVTLGLAGVLLLWLGATAERRMRQLHEFEDYFRHLH
jgi:hypothetical protein